MTPEEYIKQMQEISFAVHLGKITREMGIRMADEAERQFKSQQVVRPSGRKKIKVRVIKKNGAD